MARTKQTAKLYGEGIVTWTRFHLPPGQEWPTWSVTLADVHVGPLADVEGVWKASLGRMVETPAQAAYIIGKFHRNWKVIACFMTGLSQNQSGGRLMT